MKKVGLTGNIGCGKSTVAQMFKKLGAYVLDADKLIHSFYKKVHPVYKEVLKVFGEEILDKEGNIDRKKLARIVFTNKEKLQILENITHKALYKEIDEILKTLPENSIFILEAALLVEKGTYKNYDKLIVVWAPYEVCKERALKRGMSEEDFERRWKNQMPIDEKVKYADFVIDNSKSFDETLKQVNEIYKRLIEDP
ncbi:MAG TPA: dephospho-CoA kinase [Aquifex aeolicus]|nr:dephospho-CoA kinase [Aquifex aeolicus]